MTLYAGLRLLHILAFAAYAGALVLQVSILQASRREGLGDAVRRAYEGLARRASFFEHLGIGTSLVTGIVMLVLQPGWLKGQGWLHGKLTLVAILLVLTILQSRNNRLIVEGDEPGARKARGRVYGAASIALVLVVVTMASLKPF